MTLLEARSITKRFAGITALDDVSLAVEPGEAVGLIGPNGAGKTTFFNCLLGMLRPDGGSVHFDGTNISRYPVHKRARLGFGRTFQRVELFSGMTVREHLLVAERARLGTGRLWKDCLNLAKPTDEECERVQQTLKLLGLDDVADRRIEALSLGRARLVELGRALMTDPLLLSCSTSRPRASTSTRRGISCRRSTTSSANAAPPSSWSSTTSAWCRRSRAASTSSTSAR